jgi:hypothetical protein
MVYSWLKNVLFIFSVINLLFQQHPFIKLESMQDDTTIMTVYPIPMIRFLILNTHPILFPAKKI